MATLQNKKIKDTYQGLLKTADNNTIGTGFKEITDGSGNGTGVYIRNTGQIRLTGGSPAADKILKSDADGIASWGEVSVSYNELKVEFKDYVVLTPAATVTVDLSLGQAFELTPNQNTNVNFTNIQTKVVDLTIIGDGTAHGITFGINGVYTGIDIKKIDGSKDYDGTSGVEYLYELDFKKSTSPEKMRYLISTVTP